jgi:hypothetical protein
VAETANEKRARRQRNIEAQDLDIEQMSKKKSARFNLPGMLANAVTGESDYGTELSPGAEYARSRATKEKFPNLPFRKDGYTSRDADVLRAGREAAAEERREGSRTSPGMKKGGVTRADGCITKGHTKGRMV